MLDPPLQQPSAMIPAPSPAYVDVVLPRRLHRPFTYIIPSELKGRGTMIELPRACLVADEHAMSGNLERLLKQAGQEVHSSKPILEINPQHMFAR